MLIYLLNISFGAHYEIFTEQVLNQVQIFKWLRLIWNNEGMPSQVTVQLLLTLWKGEIVYKNGFNA